VRYVTGTKVLRILKGHGLAPEIPEDLYHLIKKAVSMRKHMERNRKDKDSKFRLILIESRIHRLARYYKVRGAWVEQGLMGVGWPRGAFTVIPGGGGVESGARSRAVPNAPSLRLAPLSARPGPPRTAAARRAEVQEAAAHLEV
jgi:ribosomal protein S15P/S13E